MSTQTNSDFLLLSRGKWDPNASKADIEADIDRFYAWYEANLAAGTFKPGSRLTMDGAIVSRDGIRHDGPFAEGKEVIGGYWIIVAGSLEAAAAIAAQNPVLKHGLTFEVRPLDDACGSAYRTTNETPQS